MPLLALALPTGCEETLEPDSGPKLYGWHCECQASGEGGFQAQLDYLTCRPVEPSSLQIRADLESESTEKCQADIRRDYHVGGTCDCGCGVYGGCNGGSSRLERRP